MRMYRMFEDKEKQIQWEKRKESQNKGYRTCMRMSAKQLQRELPYIDIEGYRYATIYTYDK